MKNVIVISLVVFAVICSGCIETACDKNCSSAKPEVITEANYSRIVGMQWHLDKMVIEGKEITLAQERPYIKFEQDKRVNGWSGVNNYFGSFKFNDDAKIKWFPFGATMMAGSKEMMGQERLYIQAIEKTEEMSLDGIWLSIKNSDSTTSLLFYVPVQ